MKDRKSFVLRALIVSPFFAGALFLTTGCETVVDDPMPPGAYRPQPVPASPDPDSFTLRDPAEAFLPPSSEMNLEPTYYPVDSRPATDAIKYKIQKGDSLSKIAKRHGVTTNELAAYNNMNKNDTIYAGRTLLIPPYGTAPAKATSVKNPGKSTLAPSPVATKPVAREAVPADGIYVVKKGDSLSKIGARYGVSAVAIASASNISVDKVLQIGEKLTIPQPGSKPVAAPGKTTSGNPGLVVPPPLNPTMDNTEKTNKIDFIEEEQPGVIVIETDEEVAFPTTIEFDATLEELAELYGCNLSDLQKLNPDLPKTGKIKAGTKVSVPL